MNPVERLRILLGRRWAGAALAAVVLVLGAFAHGFQPVLAWILLASGGILAVGVLVTLVQERSLPPPPGDIHLIDGKPVHILAEGEKRGNHPVIWVAGGHGEGLTGRSRRRTLPSRS